MQKLRWFIYKYAHIRGATKYAQPCRFKYAEMNDAANMQVFMKSVRPFRVRFFHIGVQECNSPKLEYPGSG